MVLHQPYTCIWVQHNAKEMAQYYCSIFKNTIITSENAFALQININGAIIMLLNGNNDMQLNDSFSLVINCETQVEIDTYWNALLANGGIEKACGWLQDKYGIRWQIVPCNLGKIMGNPKAVQSILPVFMQMKKIIIADLENALLVS